VSERRRIVIRGVRLLGGAGIVALLGCRLGGGPFLAAVSAVDGVTLAAATGIGVLTTVLSAWRWTAVAGGLGIRLPLRVAVADYYRALFVNAVLPGGVLGDVQRAVRHGRGAGDVPRAVRAVVLERFAGQLVLAAVGLVVLGPRLLSRPSGTAGLGVAAASLGLVAVGVAVARSGAAPARRVSGWARELGHDALPHGRRAGVLIASALVLVGHLATFLLAARAAGSSAPVGRLAPLALTALLAMTVPVNIGGWGPREGATAWAFAAAGGSAGQGLTVAVLYGLFALVASLPGAGVLVVTGVRSPRTARSARPGAGEQVAQQDDVAQPADLGQRGPAARPGREPAGTDQPRRPGLTDEERRDRQLQLVHQPGGQELGVHALAALDHQPPDPTPVKVGQQPGQLHRVTGVRHSGDRAQPAPGRGQHRPGAVDQPVGVPGGEEGGGRVQHPTTGQHHLDRRRALPAGHPLLASPGRADQQPGVVPADGPGADQDRVAVGAGGIHPIEVGVVGQQQPLRGHVVQAAVDRHAATEQHVRSLGHPRRPPVPVPEPAAAGAYPPAGRVRPAGALFTPYLLGIVTGTR
jgi:uncharacterized membrane protein YbhN (UPF0104 family)